jgi:electron transfer flavoprotein alpha subunit
VTRPLRIVALAKQVPRSDETGELGEDGRLRRAELAAEMNPFCRRAVGHAVRLAQETGGTSTVITMGPPGAADVAREALACGADQALHVSDPLLAGADSLVTARALAAAVRLERDVDLLVVGRNSVDGDTAAVGPMIAEYLQLPFVGPAIRFDVDTGDDGRPFVSATLLHEGDRTEIRVPLPAVVAVAERSGPAAKAPPETWPAVGKVRAVTVSDLGASALVRCASPTFVQGVRPAPSHRGGTVLADGPLDVRVCRAAHLLATRCAVPFGHDTRAAQDGTLPLGRHHPSKRAVFVAVGDDVADAGRALLGAAAVVAAEVGGHVVALAPRERSATLTQWGADHVLAPDGWDPQKLSAALSAMWADPPWAVLGPATAWGRELLGRLAVALRAGLISDVTALEVTGTSHEPRLLGLKPTAGGQLAEIGTRAVAQLATVRTGCLPLRRTRPAAVAAPVESLALGAADPVVRVVARCSEDDYEALDRAETVIGVGRGVAPEAYFELDKLRELLGAELAATRAVTDRAWLPQSRQVGITARAIAPRLYIAAGISGSSYHTAGIARAGTVMAINNDPDAEIFARADIGIVGDWREVVPLLVEELTTRMRQPPAPSPAG